MRSMQLQVCGLFSDGMIVQAGKPVRVFGEGTGVVTVRFAGQERAARSERGRWETEFPPMVYGGPYTMELSLGPEQKIIRDILVGEVLLCAGQSNMQFTVTEEEGNAALEENPLLRTFSAGRAEDYDGLKPADGWQPARRETIPYWSAIGYHLGAALQEKTGAAVGVVVCCQGASVIQSWMPAAALTDPAFQIPADRLFEDHHSAPFREWNQPAMLYHRLFLPLAPCSVGSLIWYQGESNTSEAEGAVYLQLLSAMLTAWRQALRDPELPVVLVEICDFQERQDRGWRLVQAAQREAGRVLPKVIAVSSGDVCAHGSIHPPKKQQLSKKLADVLLHLVTGT